MTLAIRRGVEAVKPGYFAALGTPILAGRDFVEADGVGAGARGHRQPGLAAALWPSGTAIGSLLRLGTPDEQAPVVSAVGVVSNIRRSRMHDLPVARVYLPFAQYPDGALTIVVRQRTRVAGLERTLQAAVAEADPRFLLESLRGVEDDIGQFMAPLRLMTGLLSLFWGRRLAPGRARRVRTMSYVVSQRRHEMAVRAALGATRHDLVRLVLGSAGRLTGLGAVVGIAGALAATRLLRTYLFGVDQGDPLTLAAVLVFLSVVSAAACCGPALVAASADPMSLLRF